MRGHPPRPGRKRMTWPTKTQQIGLVLVLTILVLLALARALAW